MRDRVAVQAAVAGCDYVFHQAAIRITLCAAQPRDCIDVLVGGTFNVFEAAVAAKVKKVVYASSASVYGAADTFPTDEKHHPYNNRTLYGAAKLMNEGIARSFRDMYGLPSVGPAVLQRVRPANGPDRRLHRGVHPLARVCRQVRPPTDPRRRDGDDGSRVRWGHRAGQHPGDEV